MRSPLVRRLGPVAVSCVVAVVALVLALVVTPAAAVTVFGQDLRLGAVSPTSIRGFSGPGVAELFGEGPVATALQFPGPIRPRIVWQRFDRNAAASQFIETSPSTGPTLRTSELGNALAAGWTSYFIQLVVVAAVLGATLRLVLIGAAAIAPRRAAMEGSRPGHLGQVLLTAVLAAAITAACAAFSVGAARTQLASIGSLADITGTAPLVPARVPAPPAQSAAQVAVIGDSTAAGVGNTDIAHPSAYDTACGRSQDAYARVIASAVQRSVVNLACSSATLETGLLGPQAEGDVTVPPQVGVLQDLSELRVVIVSVGANDVGWADFLRLCYGLPRCDDQLSERLFQNRLDTFRIQYAQLLHQLATLPTHPAVIIVGYYDPFGDTFDCPALTDPQAPVTPPPGYGFAADPGQDNQPTKVSTKIDPMRSELTQLNAVLADGAKAFSFTSVEPSFSGHALCTPQPWVQGLSDHYPFHPNSAGELAIAAALLPDVASLLPTTRA